MTSDSKSNAVLLVAFVVASLAVVGYFTGLQAPMRVTSPSTMGNDNDDREVSPAALGVGVLPATHYKDMAAVTRDRRTQTQLTSLKSSVDPLAEIQIDPQDKLAALYQRKQNRAFNGAPPTVPHPIEQQSDASCVACHQEGAMTQTLRIPRMSHTFLANCTQCHIENSPRHMPKASFRESEFVGLAAPVEGPRAFAGAPPQIPHSTWMRSDCLSCHGNEGRHGIRTTHPWRSSCQQCHVPSAEMDQSPLTAVPQFLPALEIRN
jgi:nitrate reductase (cytochrome), electron transfer subunit